MFKLYIFRKSKHFAEINNLLYCNELDKPRKNAITIRKGKVLVSAIMVLKVMADTH